jgi:GGDEF domain-containing protein
MRAAIADPDELVALGAFFGVQAAVICFSVLTARAYRERSLFVHAAAGALALFALLGVADSHPVEPEALMLLALAGAGVHLLQLTADGGAMPRPHRWLVHSSLGAVPLLAVASPVAARLLWPGAAAWAVVAAVTLLRLWPHGRPWRWWLLAGQLSLGAAALWLAQPQFEQAPRALVTLAALLAIWSACVFLASVGRSRVAGEMRAHDAAHHTIDPLTGLATALVLGERVQAARNTMRRYGHPSVLMLVHIENLPSLAGEFGAQAAEDALLAAAGRIRQALPEGDLAALVGQNRVAVLAEGVAPAEAAANVASRILVAGLREPLASLPAEFLHFRIVLGVIPAGDVPLQALLQRLEARLSQELSARTERHIVSVPSDEMMAA